MLVLAGASCWFRFGSTCKPFKKHWLVSKRGIKLFAHCMRPQYLRIARNSYGGLHCLFTSIASDFAYLHWHPDDCCYKLASWWKSFVYSTVDESEQRKLALFFLCQVLTRKKKALREKDISGSAALILMLFSNLFIHHESDNIIEDAKLITWLTAYNWTLETYIYQ